MQLVVDNIITSYKTYGSEESPCLLILHGWGRSGSDWEHVAAQLASDYFVVLLDLPGFGQTSLPSFPFTIFDYADFVTKFMTKMKLTRFNLMGHSFGGRLGIILGAESVQIDKLILVDPGGTEVPNFLYKIALRISKPFYTSLPKGLRHLFRKLLGSTDYLQAGELKEIFKKVVNQDLSYLLPKIKPETLVVWGSKDAEVNVKLAKKYRDEIPNNQLTIFWECGHHPHLERPSEFVEVVSEFLHD